MALREFFRIWGKNLKSDPSKWLIVVLRICIGVLAAIGTDKMSNYANVIYTDLDAFIGPRKVQVVIGLSVITIGIVAYLFKQMSQFWYGLVEVAVGCGFGFSIALTMEPQTTSLAQWSSLVALSYVIARGFNNMKDARTSAITREFWASHPKA